jgi:hypothetical protein
MGELRTPWAKAPLLAWLVEWLIPFGGGVCPAWLIFLDDHQVVPSLSIYNMDFIRMYEYILIYNFGCKSENNIITGQVTLNILFVRTEKCLRSNMYIAFTLLRKGFAELSCDYLVLISFSYPMVITLSCFNNFIMECYLQWFWFHIDWSTTCILDH